MRHISSADDVNLVRNNIDAIKKNTETLIDTSKEAGLEINIEKLSARCCLNSIQFI
jgi:hypothetical protein